MLSESHSSSRSRHEQLHVLAPPTELQALAAHGQEVRTALQRLRRRAEPWLAALLVALTVWASWQGFSWLIERWQIH